jgi:hypothetical protein
MPCFHDGNGYVYHSALWLLRLWCTNMCSQQACRHTGQSCMPSTHLVSYRRQHMALLCTRVCCSNCCPHVSHISALQQVTAPSHQPDSGRVHGMHPHAAATAAACTLMLPLLPQHAPSCCRYCRSMHTTTSWKAQAQGTRQHHLPQLQSPSSPERTPPAQHPGPGPRRPRSKVNLVMQPHAPTHRPAAPQWCTCARCCCWPEAPAAAACTPRPATTTAPPPAPGAARAALCS